METYNIIFLSIVGVIIAVYLFDRFTGHGLMQKVVQWKPSVIALSAFVDALANVLPSGQFKVISTVLRAASTATQQAEKLYTMNKLPKEERNEFAQLLIADALKTAGIEVTEQIQEIIDGCIAVVCMLLPHGVEPSAPEGELVEA